MAPSPRCDSMVLVTTPSARAERAFTGVHNVNWGIDREYWMDAIVIVILAVLFVIVIPK